jgi:hypothetical protein
MAASALCVRVATCPVHPDCELQPLPGGGARGICPLDGASHQMSAPEAVMTTASATKPDVRAVAA